MAGLEKLLTGLARLAFSYNRDLRRDAAFHRIRSPPGAFAGFDLGSGLGDRRRYGGAQSVVSPMNQAPTELIRHQ